MSSAGPKDDDAQRPRQRDTGTRPPNKQSTDKPTAAKGIRPPSKQSTKSASGRAKATAAGTTQRAVPPTPPAATPTSVHENQLPRHEFEPPNGDGQTKPSSRPLRASTVLIALGFVLIFVFGVINGQSGSTNKASGGVVSVPGPTTPTTPTTSTTPTTPTPTQHKGPSVAWRPREITVERNTSFNLDSPGLKNEPTGFEIGFVSEHGSNNFTTVGGAGKVAPWTGAGQPYYKDCANSLSSTNTEYVALDAPGRWLCAETDNHLVVRLRYDGNSGESFRFFVTAYHPAT
jgi:hypothetical protein